MPGTVPMIREVVSPEISFGIGTLLLLGALIYGVVRAGQLSPREKAKTDAATRAMQQSYEARSSRAPFHGLTIVLFAVVSFGLLCLLYSGYILTRNQSLAAASSGTSANVPTASAEGGSPDLQKGTNK